MGGVNHSQGRGRDTQCYFHSLQSNHHVYINLHTVKVRPCAYSSALAHAQRLRPSATQLSQVYCLPEGYEVLDPGLDDVKV